MRMRILDQFSTSLTVAEYGILDLLAFIIQSPADFHDTRRIKMTDADKRTMSSLGKKS